MFADLDARVALPDRPSHGMKRATSCKAPSGSVPSVTTVPLRAAKGPGKKDGPGRPDDGDGKTGLITKTRPVTKKPHLYKVLLLNDDYTPMEFVVHVLEKYFNKGREDATRIMYQVHQKGAGVCGVYTFEVAETKVAQVMDFARQHQHPLQCRMEKE
jgi:ATP-dependent Clp protease adaptor protein ClpS